MKHLKIDEADEDLRLLRIEQVLELIPIARSSLYRQIKAGGFPGPIKMDGISLWVNREIRQWQLERCRVRRRYNEDVI